MSRNRIAPIAAALIASGEARGRRIGSVPGVASIIASVASISASGSEIKFVSVQSLVPRDAAPGTADTACFVSNRRMPVGGHFRPVTLPGPERLPVLRDFSGRNRWHRRCDRKARAYRGIVAVMRPRLGTMMPLRRGLHIISHGRSGRFFVSRS
jgi:hypothetical protein